MNWQMGNAEVKEDNSNMIMIVKPKGRNRTINKIDGVVALAMAIGVYESDPDLDYLQESIERGEKIF